jgi:hypothetical protein
MRAVMQCEKPLDLSIFDDDEGDLAAVIYKRLLTVAKGHISNQHSDQGLSLLGVAKFLAFLSSNRGRKVQRFVDQGLEGLGISRLARGRGKPKGAEMAHLHAAYVRIVEQRVSEAFRVKGEIKQSHRSKWKAVFRRYLIQQRWSLEDIDLLGKCSTPRSFAVKKACRYFKTSYSVIAADCPPVRNSTPN